MKLLSLLISLVLLSACTGQTEDPAKEALQLHLNNSAEGSGLAQLRDIAYTGPVHPGQAFRDEQGNKALALDKDSNGQTDHLRVLANLVPGQQQDIRLAPVDALADLAHAELSVRQGGQWQDKTYQADGFKFSPVTQFQVPSGLTDHSSYLRYEGPGWESDQMAYRLYLDWRNAIDVFGKKVTQPVLHQVGQDGYGGYHQMQDWGMDLLKVGKSLGVGALGRVVDGQVVHFQQLANTRYTLIHDDSLSAAFDIEYRGWQAGEQKVDLHTRYLIHAGDAATRIQASTNWEVDNLVAGLVKHGVDFIQGQGREWGYIATWGPQSLAGGGDNLGLALFYRLDQVSAIEEAEFDYLLRFTPATGPIDYQIMAAWPQHPTGPENKAGFERQLATKLAALDSPLQVGLTH